MLPIAHPGDGSGVGAEICTSKSGPPLAPANVTIRAVSDEGNDAAPLASCDVETSTMPAESAASTGQQNTTP